MGPMIRRLTEVPGERVVDVRKLAVQKVDPGGSVDHADRAEGVVRPVVPVELRACLRILQVAPAGVARRRPGPDGLSTVWILSGRFHPQYFFTGGGTGASARLIESSLCALRIVK
jgi:hypothetical protein|eukprot:COSAG01_NODE_1324_length_10724_cov_27.870776_14_plen_115_part_00